MFNFLCIECSSDSEFLEDFSSFIFNCLNVRKCWRSLLFVLQIYNVYLCLFCILRCLYQCVCTYLKLVFSFLVSCGLYQIALWLSVLAQVQLTVAGLDDDDVSSCVGTCLCVQVYDVMMCVQVNGVLMYQNRKVKKTLTLNIDVCLNKKSENCKGGGAIMTNSTTINNRIEHWKLPNSWKTTLSNTPLKKQHWLVGPS